MKRILITGAHSFVGTSVERWLKKYPGEYRVDTADARNGAWLRTDFSGYDIVFHAAGLSDVNPRRDAIPLYYSVNRDLAFEIARHAKKSGVGHFIFMSSIMVYGSSSPLGDEIIGPGSTPAPDEAYGESKLQAEKLLQSLVSPEFRIAILRPCMIYGPGCRGNFPRLVRLARRIPAFPAWHNMRSMLYVDNFCEFVRQVIGRGLSGIFHLQNKEYADTCDVVRHFARAAGHRILISSMFNPAVRIGALLSKNIGKMFGSRRYSRELTTFDFDYTPVSFQESLTRFQQ